MKCNDHRQQQPDQRLCVAVIASSGGGTATLGHTDAPAFLQYFHNQLTAVGAVLSNALFICLENGQSMDHARETVDIATLYKVDLANLDEAAFQEIALTRLPTERIARGTLKEVNSICYNEQLKIAHAIQQGKIHGLICISCHVNLFRDTLRAAAARNIAVTGTGGTSLSAAAVLFGIHFVGNAGGSVATTSLTRAVSYTNALASFWGRKYEPWKKNNNKHSLQKGPSWTSVLNSCLPAFWGVCLAKASLQFTKKQLQKEPTLPFASELLALMDSIILALTNWVLPTACAAVMATSLNPFTSEQPTDTASTSVILASMVASMSCAQTALGGLVAGWWVAYATERLFYWCILRNMPATMTNLITTGGVGALVAIGIAPVAYILRLLTGRIRWLIQVSITLPLHPGLRACVGFLYGCLSCYSSKVGGYHALHLPLILVEMELGDASFLGAVDELSLVLVCAGVCLGNLLAGACSKQAINSAHAAMSRRGLHTNLLYGDLVEVCYPFMEESPLINFGGYLGSGLSVAWLVLDASAEERLPKSLAYLPIALSAGLAGSQWKRMAGASGIAIAVPFLFTLLHHLWCLRRRPSPVNHDHAS